MRINVNLVNKISYEKISSSTQPSHVSPVEKKRRELHIAIEREKKENQRRIHKNSRKVSEINEIEVC